MLFGFAAKQRGAATIRYRYAIGGIEGVARRERSRHRAGGGDDDIRSVQRFLNDAAVAAPLGRQRLALNGGPPRSYARMRGQHDRRPPRQRAVSEGIEM